MLERWIAFGVLIGLLLVFASWANEDAPAPVEPEPEHGRPPEMPAEKGPPVEPKRPAKTDGKRNGGLVGGLLGG